MRFAFSELTTSSLNDPNCKFLAFMSCSHYDPPEQINAKDIPRYVKAHTALGGGQLGLFGTAGLHTWAEDVEELVKCFTDNTEIDKRKLFDDSAKRYCTIFRPWSHHSANHNAVFQWSICHSELKSSRGGDFEAQGNYGVKELMNLIPWE